MFHTYSDVERLQELFASQASLEQQLVLRDVDCKKDIEIELSYVLNEIDTLMFFID